MSPKEVHFEAANWNSHFIWTWISACLIYSCSARSLFRLLFPFCWGLLGAPPRPPIVFFGERRLFFVVVWLSCLELKAVFDSNKWDYWHSAKLFATCKMFCIFSCCFPVHLACSFFYLQFCFWMAPWIRLQRWLLLLVIELFDWITILKGTFLGSFQIVLNFISFPETGSGNSYSKGQTLPFLFFEIFWIVWNILIEKFKYFGRMFPSAPSRRLTVIVDAFHVGFFLLWGKKIVLCCFWIFLFGFIFCFSHLLLYLIWLLWTGILYKSSIPQSTYILLWSFRVSFCLLSIQWLLFRLPFDGF